MARNLPSASEAADRWGSGFGGSGARWAAGINSVDTPPGQLAAAAAPRYLAGVQNNAGKWANRVASVSLQQWKQASIDVGQGRLASGATKGKAKYQARIAQVLDAERSIIGGLPPRGDISANIARSSAFQMAMHQAFQGG